MARFFTNPQVLRYTLKVFWLLLAFFCFTSATLAQEDYRPRKGSVKFYEKGLQAIRDRDFQAGLFYYKKAIIKDPLYTAPYLRIASAYNLLRDLDSAYRYYDLYFQLSDPEKLTNRELFFLAELYFEHGQYETAGRLARLGKAKDDTWGKDVGKVKLVRNIDFSLQSQHEENPHLVELLPNQVNRYYSQYFPALTINGESLIFTARKGPGQRDDEDLVIAHLKNGQWEPAASISSSINSRFNEGACSISADGRSLILTSCEEGRSYGSCDLFIATKQGDKWSSPRNLGSRVNSAYWESQPSLSADGRTLYFSSNRSGGRGQRDIWVTNKEGNIWTEARNLGSIINTELDETTPYIHSNDQTLFFSSEGHIGFGGFDLYLSEKLDSNWTTPVNLGYGVNDYKDQLSLIVNADGSYGIFADEVMNEQGQLTSKLARITFATDTLISRKASYVTGKITDAVTGKPLAAEIALDDLFTSELQYQTVSDPINGDYFFVLTQGNVYGAFVTARGYLFEDFKFEVGENSILNPDTINIELQPIQENVGVILENVYFEFDSYKLSKESEAELKVVSEFLKKHNVTVEISGHTDDVGTDEYNENLSLRRAEAVYRYLLESGIPNNRMKFRGYGSKQPKFDDIAKNRRIEFKILTVN